MHTKIIEKCEKQAQTVFSTIDETAFYNQRKVLEAFKKNNIALRHFAGSSGYGYGDSGKEALCAIFADVFCAEAAIVSPLIASGTHAISTALFGILRPKDTMLSVSGTPYDTLRGVIKGNPGDGAMNDYGINYSQIDLVEGKFDFKKIKVEIKKAVPKIVYVQRSRGYEWRDSIPLAELEKLFESVKKINKEIVIVVDNCYGEFTGKYEPLELGADIIIGSLIKNPGGGLAPTGAYIAGKQKYIDLIAYRLTAPGLGTEVGSYMYGYRDFFHGLFLASHITAQALKGNALLGYIFTELGYETLPPAGTFSEDVIRSVKFHSEEELIRFCRVIQSISPVDSNAVPYPSEMPGYDHKVIMAAGCFVQGGSIELSADAPIKEPYVAYVQGGLTYEHIRIAAEEIMKNFKK